MSNSTVNDEFLHGYVRNAEKIMIDNIPCEDYIAHEFSKEFLNKMEKMIRSEKHTIYFRKISIYTKRVAIVILISLCVALTTTLSVEAYRIRFFEIITEVFDKFTSIKFQKEGLLKGDEFIPIESDYVPEGYKISMKEINQYVQKIFYQDKTGKEIIYEQKLISSNSIIVDTENGEIENIKILDQKVTVLKNKGIYQVYWHDEINTYLLIGDIEEQEFLLMAKDIIEKNK